MPELQWDLLDERFFERGIDHVVLYTPTAGLYVAGTVWNGVTGVTQAPSGSESNKQYADNIEYVNLLTRPEFGATIECLMYPTAFLKHDGVVKTAAGLRIAMQSRPVFGLSWRTLKGNAEDEDAGYVLHAAYGCQATPAEKAHMAVNDSVELTTFSWTLTTTPVVVTGHKPTAYVEIDSTDPEVDPAGLLALEDVLYGRGTDGVARLPLPDEMDELLAA